MGEFWAKLLFVVGTNMAVACILSTMLIDRFVMAIFPGRKLIFSLAVAIIGSTAEDFPRNADKTNRSTPSATATKSTKIHPAKPVGISPLSEAQFLVRSDQPGLRFPQNHPKMARKNISLMAIGVMGFVPGRPFRVLIRNFSDKAIRLHNSTVVDLGLASSGGILSIE